MFKLVPLIWNIALKKIVVLALSKCDRWFLVS